MTPTSEPTALIEEDIVEAKFKLTMTGSAAFSTGFDGTDAQAEAVRIKPLAYALATAQRVDIPAEPFQRSLVLVVIQRGGFALALAKKKFGKYESVPKIRTFVWSDWFHCFSSVAGCNEGGHHGTGLVFALRPYANNALRRGRRPRAAFGVVRGRGRLVHMRWRDCIRLGAFLGHCKVKRTRGRMLGGYIWPRPLRERGIHRHLYASIHT